MRLEVYGGRIVQESTDYETAITARRHFRQINPGGYWGRASTHNLDKIDVALLHVIRAVKDNNPNVKIRVEEPEIQFYAETENELKTIVDQLGPKYRHIVLGISGPANQQTQNLLKSGVIIRKKNFSYKYKVVLRDGRCNVITKQQMLNYLEGLGTDEVKVSGGVKRMLSSKFDGFWNIWFYANDEKVTTFLELIHPGCILNIHPVVVT